MKQVLHKVSMSISNVQNPKDVRKLADQISNSLSGFEISNVVANTTDLSFNLTTKDKQPIAPEKIGYEIKKYIDSNQSSIQIVSGNVVGINVDDKVVGDDMWSW